MQSHGRPKNVVGSDSKPELRQPGLRKEGGFEKDVGRLPDLRFEREAASNPTDRRATESLGVVPPFDQTLSSHQVEPRVRRKARNRRLGPQPSTHPAQELSGRYRSRPEQ